jgi:cytidylate kinase
MAAEDTYQVTTQLTNHRVVAVDGGTATGKGRLITELAALLRSKGIPVVHISSGDLYRAATYVSLVYTRDRIPAKRAMSDVEILHESVAALRDVPVERVLELVREHSMEMHGGVVWLDGKPCDVDGQLKGPGIGRGIPVIAAHLDLRILVTNLVRRQINEFDGYLLIDGRDIGESVVPDAPLKLLLTVAPEIAAQRSQEHTKEEIIARDKADRAHTYGALPHPDSPGENVIVLPTDAHTPESVRDHVYDLMLHTFPELPLL